MSKEIVHRWPFLFCITAIGFGLDLATKALAVRYLSGGTVKHLFGGHLELLLVYNKAALFGLDPRHLLPGFPLNLFFTVLTVIAVGALIWYYRSLKKSERMLHWGLAAVLPGALGNLFDRIAHSGRGVVDFIKVDLGFPPFNPWPVFNLADAWVTIGVALMLAAFLFDGKDRGKPSAPSS